MSDEYVKLGTAHLVGGCPLDVIAGPDDTVTLYEPESTISFTLSDYGRDELRELLDRHAMPGQAECTAEAHAAQAGDGGG